MNNELVYTDNVSSWHRLWMLFKFYWPGCLRRGTLIMALSTLAFVLLGGLVLKAFGFFPSILMFPLTMVLYLSPIMLTRRDYRFVSAQLPVTVGEKIGFLLIYFGFVIPLVMAVSVVIGGLLSIWILNVDIVAVLDSVGSESLQAMPLAFLPVYFFAILIIILYYMITRQNRPLAAMVSFFMVFIALTVLSFIGGMVIGVVAMVSLANPAMACSANAIADSESALAPIIAQGMPIVMTVIICILTASGIIYLSKLAKYLRNSGF